MTIRPINPENTRSFSLTLLFLFATFLLVGCSSSGKKYVIGAGHKEGYYNSTAKSISEIINQNNEEFKSSIKTTSGGSAPNISGIMAGDFDFAIAQSDYVYRAWKGAGEWQELGPQSNLRAVLSLYAESVTLVATDDSGINSLKDLKGKKVNLGKPDSDHHKLAIQVLSTAGLDWKNDLIPYEEKASEGPNLIQQGEVDAFFYVLAHPSSRILRALSGKKKTHLVPIENMVRLLEENPFYAKSTIPISWYPKTSNNANVLSIGVKTLLITSKSTPDDIVYSYTKKITDNIAVLQTIHPALKYINKVRITEALSIPIHSGALKYLKEEKLFDGHITN